MLFFFLHLFLSLSTISFSAFVVNKARSPLFYLVENLLADRSKASRKPAANLSETYCFYSPLH